MEDEIRRELDARRYAEAFALLVEHFKVKVFRLALSMVQNTTEAEDLAQDVFVKIWKHLPGYRGGSSLATWIYTITRNTCLTEIKRRAARPTLSLQHPGCDWIGDGPAAMHSIDRESGASMDVQVLLMELPEKYRQVISLFYLEQKSYEEVATMLNLPLGTVKTLLFRARKELVRIASRCGGRTLIGPESPKRDFKQASLPAIATTGLLNQTKLA
jgi:RNA polymerase sigma-70 factor (ECF subfamily)